jgi:hypothetical protein
MEGGLVIATGSVLSRFLPDGSQDGNFGGDGKAIAGIYVPYAVWRESDGGWTFAGVGEENIGFGYIGENYLRAIRFGANDAYDASFGVRPFGSAARVRGEYGKEPLVRASDGRVLFAGDTCLLERYLTDAPRAETTVVEYYHPGLDHYFMTSSTNEIEDLDSNAQPGWIRTGESFGAWSPGNLPGAAHVCRFYGDPVIGPNSHFYTGEDFECNFLIQLDAATPRGQPAWHLEAKPFDIAIPSNGACPANLQPVYRVFNGIVGPVNGPNHRYTTDTSLYAAMQAKGWLPEGAHFCAPPRLN